MKIQKTIKYLLGITRRKSGQIHHVNSTKLFGLLTAQPPIRRRLQDWIKEQNRENQETAAEK